MKQRTQSWMRALTSVAVASCVATACWSQQQPSIRWLGILPGAYESEAFGVSADGQVVVGWSGGLAFRWTAADGMQGLGAPSGFNHSQALGVSADGRVVVGRVFDTQGRSRAFRWENGEFRLLGLQSAATNVSADGQFIVGWVYRADSTYISFRWGNGAPQQLGTLQGYRHSQAQSASADGRVVVGWSVGGFVSRAFRWTAGDGMQDLGTLPGFDASSAYDVSADGQVVVGVAIDYRRVVSHALRWEDGALQDLGTLPGGTNSVAFAVSADGRVVVGEADNAQGAPCAFRWENDVMEDLNQRYASLLTDGSRLFAARDISANGRYIVGEGYNAATGRLEAFLLDTGASRRDGDVNGDSCVDDNDLLRVLFAFGSTGTNLPEDLNGDGTVDDADLLVVLFNFGNGC